MESSARMTKNLFLNALQCRTLAWYLAREKQTVLSDAEHHRMEEGKEVGLKAIAFYFPEGILVTGTLQGAAALTQKLLADVEVGAVFEGVFLEEGYAARPDALIRDGIGYRLAEVKSSLHNDVEADEEHIDDLAYTASVLKRCGINITSTELVRISRDWRLGMEEKDLFRTFDCSEAVFARAAQFELLWSEVLASTFAETPPPPTHIKQCGACQYFADKCLGMGISNPIYQLPRLSSQKFEKLIRDKIFSLNDIPGDFELTPTQSRMVKSCRSRQPEIDTQELKRLLGSVEWPAYYLDFETVKTALPFWPEIGPHEQVLTQYSLHICDRPGRVIQHMEFLSTHTGDCRFELAQNLLESLGTSGSIIVYSSFEKTTLGGLAKQFPLLREQLEACICRLFDLEKVFSAYYHPEFRGRTSIKVTLPALVPEMSYTTLAIGDGETAIAMFARMAKGNCDEMDIENIRRDLLEYCRQDTLAMVKLHEQLMEIASA